MAMKYELDINIGSNNDQESDTTRPSRSSNSSGIFARPRTRSRKFSMDIFNSMKENVSESAYEITEKRTGSKEKAAQSAFSAGYGIAVATNLASDVFKAGMSNIGTFTSNKATQNAVDNISSVGTNTLSSVGTVGAGAAMGGWVGALIAGVSVVADKALKIAQSALDQSKKNVISSEESTRARNRLGYIESGYSR